MITNEKTDPERSIILNITGIADIRHKIREKHRQFIFEKNCWAVEKTADTTVAKIGNTKRGDVLLNAVEARNSNDAWTNALLQKLSSEIMDITTCSSALERDISRLRVLVEPSLPDYRTCSFRWSANAIWSPPIAYRNPRTVDWSLYCTVLEGSLEIFLANMALRRRSNVLLAF